MGAIVNTTTVVSWLDYVALGNDVSLLQAFAEMHVVISCAAPSSTTYVVKRVQFLPVRRRILFSHT